jgi:REP element-mobilizing transposase RayT
MTEEELKEVLINLKRDHLYFTTREQKERLESIQNKDIKKFVKELAKNNGERMEVALQMFDFLHKLFTSPPKRKNHKRAYVIEVFKKVEKEHPTLTKKECIQHTATKLDITYNAVKSHIYRKSKQFFIKNKC